MGWPRAALGLSGTAAADRIEEKSVAEVFTVELQQASLLATEAMQLSMPSMLTVSEQQ
jgi:hypothetical protein